MFVVECLNDSIYHRALNDLRDDLDVVKMAEVNPDNSITLVVQNETRLTEAYFQMNWRQKGSHLCAMCARKIELTGEGDDCCGHLTFTKPLYH